jgi:F0F1-type ATP synthase membrane subunit b/b'
VSGQRTRRAADAACESWRKLARAAAALVLVVCVGAPVIAQHESAPGDQPAAPGHEAPVSEHAVAEGHTDEAQHGESIWGFAGKVFNFAVLAGTLVYLLRKPLIAYFLRRGSEIRGDLDRAESMKRTAAEQIAEINAKLQQMPAELDALRTRGAQEIAAEEARIAGEAEAERTRLLEQTRREIDLQLRLARRELVNHAADLAVSVARERIRTQITDRDQLALVDRYLSQVSARD